MIERFTISRDDSIYECFRAVPLTLSIPFRSRRRSAVVVSR
ncbi:MAG: hypothetical protein U9R79_10000 [Armatimonadota bacterium]|nr:hypothetical protein [Armatimonadota bacterium]